MVLTLDVERMSIAPEPVVTAARLMSCVGKVTTAVADAIVLNPVPVAENGSQLKASRET